MQRIAAAKSASARAILSKRLAAERRQLAAAAAQGSFHFHSGNRRAVEAGLIGVDDGGLGMGWLAESLALQLHFSFEVCAPEMGTASLGLVGAPPQRPCDDVSGLDALVGELDGDAADFLDRPADQARRFCGSGGGVFLNGAALAWWRMAVIMAKASITSETCLCQPCQERVSL